MRTVFTYRVLTVGAQILQVHGIRGAWQMKKEELVKQLTIATSHGAAKVGPND